MEYKKKHREDEAYHRGLDAWAQQVLARAQGKLAEAVRRWPQEPDGYPGLRQQLKAACSALVFGPEYRSPHGFFFACGRWYQHQLFLRCTAEGAFQVEDRSIQDVLYEMQAFNDQLGL